MEDEIQQVDITKPEDRKLLLECVLDVMATEDDDVEITDIIVRVLQELGGCNVEKQSETGFRIDVGDFFVHWDAGYGFEVESDYNEYRD